MFISLTEGGDQRYRRANNNERAYLTSSMSDASSTVFLTGFADSPFTTNLLGRTRSQRQ